MASGAGARRRRDVVVVTAVLVVAPDQQGLGPRRARHRGVDHPRRERLTGLDVLGVLLGRVREVGLDQRERRQRARGRVAVVAVDRREVLGVRGAAAEQSRARKVRVVVLPGDPVRVELLEDGPARRRRRQDGTGVHDEAGGRPRDEIAAVRVRLGEHRREPPVAQHERPCERGVERQVVRGPVAHRDRTAGEDEPVVAAVGVRDVALVPPLRRLPRQLARRGHPERVDGVALTVGVRVGRAALAIETEAVAAAEQAEVVVVGVVLHHQHEDVLDLRHRVRARRQVRVRQRTGPAQRLRLRRGRERPGQPAPASGGGRADRERTERRAATQEVAARDHARPVPRTWVNRARPRCARRGRTRRARRGRPARHRCRGGRTRP